MAGSTGKEVKDATGQDLADAMFFITSAGLRGNVALEALTYSAKASAAGLGNTVSISDLIGANNGRC